MSRLSLNIRQSGARTRILAVFVASLALWGCTTTPRPHPGAEPPIGSCEFYQKGLASWYGDELLGNRTANGEMFVPNGVTAAHRTLPFGTILRVFLDNPKNKRANPEGVVVRVNDRGPFVRGRVIDLSWGAAKHLGMMDTQQVKIYRCSP